MRHPNGDSIQTTGIGAGKAANIKNCELCARKIAEVADSNKVKCHTPDPWHLDDTALQPPAAVMLRRALL